MDHRNEEECKEPIPYPHPGFVHRQNLKHGIDESEIFQTTDFSPSENISGTLHDSNYDWVKEEHMKRKLIDLNHLTDTIVSDTSSGHISIQLNSTKLLEQRLQHVKQLQFDEKQAKLDILHDENDRIDIFHEASKVSWHMHIVNAIMAMFIFYLDT